MFDGPASIWSIDFVLPIQKFFLFSSDAGVWVDLSSLWAVLGDLCPVIFLECMDSLQCVNLKVHINGINWKTTP